jgi:hypothetical protein
MGRSGDPPRSSFASFSRGVASFSAARGTARRLAFFESGFFAIALGPGANGADRGA